MRWGVSMQRVSNADALAAQALAPIDATLHDMAARQGRSLPGLAPDLVVTDHRGWVRATQLTSGARLHDFLAMAQRHWRGAEPHVAASLAWKHYTYWATLPAVLGFASARRVPLMRPEAVVVRWSPQPPFLRVGLASTRTTGSRRRPAIEIAVLPDDPVLVHGTGRGIKVVPHEAALLDELRTALRDEHLTPLVGLLHSHLHLGRRLLWGALASAVATGLSRAADVLPGSTLQTTRTLLRSLDLSKLVDVETGPGSVGIAVARKTCCLALRLPEPTRCPACPAPGLDSPQ